ncbi:hypothetical protein PRIC1_006888 [Phytophthora ramorum]|nr:hypothetical protein KRP22_3606 [Phytophthora ramorum]
MKMSTLEGQLTYELSENGENFCVQQAKKYNKRLKRYFPDYTWVASNSQPRRSVSTVCKVYRSELPSCLTPPST